MKDTETKITIIIATFNSDLTIENSILSVINQTYKNLELIIIDGGSKDNTLNIINKYKKFIHYWKSEKDRGVYDAWNKALEFSNGDWIYFLGSDDYLSSNDIIENVVRTISEKQLFNYKLVYGRVAIFEKNLILKIKNTDWEKTKNNFFKFGNIHHQGVFHNKNIFKDYGNFDITFKFAADYELILRSTKSQDPFFINILVAYSQVGGLSSQPKNAYKVFLEYKYALLKNSLYHFNLTWFNLLIYSILKLFAYKFLPYKLFISAKR